MAKRASARKARARPSSSRIAKMVDDLALEMSADGQPRADYIDAIEVVIVGAIREFYKGALASKLHLSLASHWTIEAHELVRGPLVAAVGVRGVKDRGDAFMQAVRCHARKGQWILCEALFLKRPAISARSG